MKEIKFDKRAYKNEFDKRYERIHIKIEPHKKAEFKKKCEEKNTDMSTFLKDCIKNFENIHKKA